MFLLMKMIVTSTSSNHLIWSNYNISPQIFPETNFPCISYLLRWSPVRCRWNLTRLGEPTNQLRKDLLFFSGWFLENIANKRGQVYHVEESSNTLVSLDCSIMFNKHFGETFRKSALKNVYIYMIICMHTYIHTYIRTYIHTYIRTYIHTYIRTYIHTYIHTYIQANIHTIP